MKNLLTLLAVTAVVTGCRSFTATLANGTSIHSSSFACKLTVGNVEISTNGTARLNNYNLDQVAGTEAVIKAAVAGAVQGAK